MTLPDKTISNSLAQRTLTGLNWKFLTVVVQTPLTFVVGIVLARIIPPEDFGLLGMAVVFTGMAELFGTLGMGPAIIQRRPLSKSHIQVALTLSTILSLIITLAFWTSANMIAQFFGDSRVSLVVKVVSLTFLLKGLATISRSILRRKLHFNKIFFIETSSLIFGYSIFSIPMAFLGYGVWSLVVGTLAQTIISCSLFLFVSRPPLIPSLGRKEIRDLIGFGSGISLINVLNYAATNIDYLVIGKFLSAKNLGLYTRAYGLMKLTLNQFSASVSTVLFPAYAEIQNERSRISEAYFKTINATAIVAFPIMTGLAVCSEYILVGLYGPNWSGATTVLRILCFAGMLKSIFHLAGSIVQATGKIYSEAWRQLVYLLLVTVGSLFGVRYGIEGVCFAVIFASLWLYLSMAQLVLNILGKSWGNFLSAQLPGLIIASMVGILDIILIALSMYFLPGKMILLKLLCLVGASAGTLLLSLVFLPKRIKGEMPEWLANKYSNFFPKRFRDWVTHHI